MIEMGNKAMDKAAEVREDLMKIGRQVWLAGLGLMAVAEEKGRETFDTLIEKGQGKDVEKTIVGKVINQASEQMATVTKKVEGTVQDTSKAVLHRFGMPTHDEIEALIARVETLTAKVEAMNR